MTVAIHPADSEQHARAMHHLDALTNPETLLAVAEALVARADRVIAGLQAQAVTDKAGLEAQLAAVKGAEQGAE